MWRTFALGASFVAWLFVVCTPLAPACGQSTKSPEVGAGVQVAEFVEQDWLEEDLVFIAPTSDPRQKPQANAAGVTTAQDAAGGCDGVKNGRCGFHTASQELDPWWQVDLGKTVALDRVVVYNRTDGGTAARTRRIEIRVATDAANPEFVEVYRHTGETFYGVNETKPLLVSLRDRQIEARIVRLCVPGRCSLALDEVEVYATDQPDENLALGRPADQKSVGPYSFPGTKGHASAAPQVVESAASAFRLEHTRAVISRGRQLADRLQRASAGEILLPLIAELGRLDEQVDQLASCEAISVDARREVFFQARRLNRKIAFCNPLLDFDKILFVKRHDPGGLYHMVHQYYGFCATPGGGLFVLHDPFSDRPYVTDLLADSKVAGGRLDGRTLEPGTFIAPDLSYDGRSILFAYTEGKADSVEWSPRASYHIFKVNADGSDLRQLTDEPWNEFDPCFLPDGRIVFISERRGGYLRCGGSAPPYDSPTYTLHSMDVDGGNIACLSFHETQEWHPSVDNNGMLVYTRWDYVDRDTNTAHHIWSCFADGRDPRSYHGNYPSVREGRPWMEMSIRAVPNSNRYVATAAAHHGLAFGSLVLIDYRPVDDNAMSQLERITPDVPFPESEGGKSMIRQRMAYGTAWPLSEDDYLCVYDRHAKNRGIYWIDRFGNRELLYRDPAISCLSPIPLRPRRRPPALPQRTTQTAAAERASDADRSATVAVMNVYDSDFAWPDGTQIAALRIIQVLPKTTPPLDQPRIGVATETNARAVLGTVPVESDGSAYFTAPAGKLVYFQALDERGLAVQSMRSATYLHPGEFLGCQGCHEAKHQPPRVGQAMPLAMRREPSTIQPDADGSNPFSYARLVQPVLDRHCVACHQEKGVLNLSGDIVGEHGWTRSYANLARDYGFYFHVSNGSINSGVHGGVRTVPGQFGARVSKLLPYLDQRHYGVQLPAEDWHRLTLWLDCNSEFFGAYHDVQAQASGEIVAPLLE